MTSTDQKRLRAGLVGRIAATALTGAAAAREPGVLPTVPTGASIGVPIAAPIPFDGIAVSSRTGLSFQSFYDNNGNETPTELTIRDTVLQFAISPGIELFGGQYRAFVSIPFVDIEGDNLPGPPGAPTRASNSGIAGVEIRPVDISWQTSPGIFVNAGLSFFTPGDWSPTEQVNPGQNFWTVSPSVGISYLRGGWNATAHLSYFANFENEDNGYHSGDEVHLNLTAMKDIGNDWSVGAVGYLREQVSADRNPLGAYGGMTGGKASQRGLGLAVTKQIGPINLNAMATTDLSARNSGGGDRIWLNAIIPVSVFGR